jgi:hypothetical protein
MSEKKKEVYQEKDQFLVSTFDGCTFPTDIVLV